jgi:hypothetical protein
MKIKQIVFVFQFISILGISFSQAPEKMSYQSVLRGTNNALVTNQNVRVKISILQGTITGTAAYVEEHSTSTNSNGLVSLSIGGGTLISGNFSTINWANGPYFVKMEADPTGGTNFTISGTTQLLSVPYALYAKTSGSSKDAWNSTGNAGTNPTTNFLGTTDANDVVFKTNNLERMRLTSVGNIGVGTSSPIYGVTIKDSGEDDNNPSATRPFGIVDVNNNNRLDINVEGNSSTAFTNIRMDAIPLDNTSQVKFRFLRTTNTTGSKSIEFLRGNNTTQVSALIGIDGLSSYFQNHGGNFGIGTSSPLGKFHVNNDVSGSDSSFVVTTAGNIGVGTSSPTEKMEFQNGGIRINGNFGIGFNDQSFGNATPNGNEGAKIYFDNTILTDTDKDYLIIEKKDGSSVSPDGGIVFTNRGNDGIRRPSMLIDGFGKVGIGTTNPSGKLHVNNDVIGSDSSFVVTTDGKVGIGTGSPLSSLTVRSSLNTPNSIMADLGNSIFEGGFRLVSSKGVSTNNVGDPVLKFGMIYGNSSTTNSALIRFHRGSAANDGSISFSTNNDAVEIMRLSNVSNLGRVGIGTSNPSATLDLNGTLKITDGTQGAGKVLTSDASGNATWQSSSAGSTVRGTSSGGFAPTVINGSGFTVTRTSSGTYSVTFTTPFTTVPTVTASVYLNNSTYTSEMQIVKVSGVTVNGFTIHTLNYTGGTLMNLIDYMPFSFIVSGN